MSIHRCTDSDIFWYTRHDQYGFLSNFYRSYVIIDGKLYMTNEHWYQANKAVREEDHEMIRQLVKPGTAKEKGSLVMIKSNWETIKEEVMIKGLKEKFRQHEILMNMLIDTGNKKLHEDSPTDMYWGYANGKGKDRLGILLMQVREKAILGAL